MKKTFRQIAIMGALLLCFATAPTAQAEQIDIYDVVGATDDISKTEKPVAKEKESTAVTENPQESSEKPVDTDVEDTKEILKDIRTMLLGILFATSWTAGAVTSGNFVKPFKRV